MTRCPKCRGEVIRVGQRAWCVRRYFEGGCGGFFRLRAGRWFRER